MRRRARRSSAGWTGPGWSRRLLVVGLRVVEQVWVRTDLEAVDLERAAPSTIDMEAVAPSTTDLEAVAPLTVEAAWYLLLLMMFHSVRTILFFTRFEGG